MNILPVSPRYKNHRFPPEIISHAVWLYHRLCLSFRDVEELLAAPGVVVSYEAVRQWCRKFGQDFAKQLRHCQGRLGDTWPLDELVVTIAGARHYLWRAVDQDGDVLDILVQKRWDTGAAKRFFLQLLKGLHYVTCRLVTDKLRSYRAAHRELLPSVFHCHDKRANNRAEVSHQPTRQQERQMRRFKSPGHAQRFLAAHGPINNLFRCGRHLMRAAHYRVLRAQAFVAWGEATGLSQAA
jgi:putative transposase